MNVRLYFDCHIPSVWMFALSGPGKPSYICIQYLKPLKCLSNNIFIIGMKDTIITNQSKCLLNHSFCLYIDISRVWPGQL